MRTVERRREEKQGEESRREVKEKRVEDSREEKRGKARRREEKRAEERGEERRRGEVKEKGVEHRQKEKRRKARTLTNSHSSKSWMREGGNEAVEPVQEGIYLGLDGSSHPQLCYQLDILRLREREVYIGNIHYVEYD